MRLLFAEICNRCRVINHDVLPIVFHYAPPSLKLNKRFVEQYLDKPSDNSLDKTRKIHDDYIFDFVFEGNCRPFSN
jgi:hypothetical protein